MPFTHVAAECRAIIRTVAGVFATMGILSFAGIAGTAGRDWPAYLGDAGGTHYSALHEINVANVKRIERAWEFRTW
jgi:glucose dehydrogenase